MRCMTLFALMQAQVLMIDPNQTGCTAGTILPTKSNKIRVTVDKTCCNQGLGYKVRQSSCEEVFWPSRSRETFWTNACGGKGFSNNLSIGDLITVRNLGFSSCSTAVHGLTMLWFASVFLRTRIPILFFGGALRFCGFPPLCMPASAYPSLSA